MKSLILLSLCLTTVLAAPWPSEQQQLNQQLDQQQIDQSRRRLQTLSVKLQDDRDDNYHDYERRDNDREDTDDHKRQDRVEYDRSDRGRSNRARSDRDRNDRNSVDHSHHHHDRRRDWTIRHEDIEKEVNDQEDRGDDDRQEDRQNEEKSESNDREDDQDGDRALRTSNLDALARQMDLVATKYGSQGRVKVAYVPPTRQSSLLVHDLGSLNFRYIPSRYGEQVKVQSVGKPVLYIPRSEDQALSYNYNSYYATPLRKLRNQDQDDIKSVDQIVL